MTTNTRPEGEGWRPLIRHSYRKDWGLPGGLLDRGEHPAGGLRTPGGSGIGGQDLAHRGGDRSPDTGGEPTAPVDLWGEQVAEPAGQARRGIGAAGAGDVGPCRQGDPVPHRVDRGLAEAVVQEGSLSVSIKVEVLEDGIPGQVVRVRNPEDPEQYVDIERVRELTMRDDSDYRRKTRYNYSGSQQ